MKLSTCAAALVAAAAVTGAGAARAEGLAACTAEDAQYAMDDTVVGESLDDFEKGDFPAVKAHIKELEAVVGRAPAAINYVELCDGIVVLRESSRLNAQATANRVLVGEDRKRKIVWRASPYSWASLMVGSFYVETGRFDAAYKALSVGLKLEPLHPEMVSEAALSLGQLGRYDEGLVLLDRALAENTGMEALDRARLLRTRGYALIELKRLDEAEKAYRDSLVAQPGHKGALGELDFIAKARKGAAKSPGQVVRSTTGEPSPEKVQ